MYQNPQQPQFPPGPMGGPPMGGQPQMAVTAERETTLSDLCQEFFILGCQIRAGTQLPDAESLRQRVMGLFQTMTQRAEQLRIGSADLGEAQYALAAYLDEVIRFSAWQDRDRWSTNPLQKMLFQESNAGINFFHHLNALRGDTRQIARDVVKVYYLCLVLGFEGQYHMGQDNELDNLIKGLRQELSRGRSRVLSIHGLSPDHNSGGRRKFPLVPLAGLAMVLSVIVAVVLYLILASTRGGVVEQINQWGGSL